MWNSISVPWTIADNSNASHATRTYGHCWRRNAVDAASGPIALQCSVEPSVPGSAGYGILRTMCGQRSTLSSNGGGSMWIHVKKRGTILDCTLKVCCCSHIRPITPIDHGLTIDLIGWGKKMSYCIAFSIDGATDVTRRYVRNATTHGTDRNKCPEEVLLYIMNEIKQMRRSNMDKDDRKRLIIQDEREEKELRGYVIQNLAAEIGRMIPLNGGLNANGGRAGQAESLMVNGEDKTPQARQTGTQAWIAARGEAGQRNQTMGPHNDQQPPHEGR